MSISVYQQALDQIEPTLRTGIEAGIALLDGQLQDNIGNETALTVDDFVLVLRLFSTMLLAKPILDSTAARDSWRDACRKHSCKGKIVPESLLPIVLGRCKTLKAHAHDIGAIGDPDFDAKEAERLLRKQSNSNNSSMFIHFMRDAVLGNNTLWATFDPTDSANNPFLRLPQTYTGICAALGLQYTKDVTAIVVLAWNHLASGAPALYRPTVADAAENPLFRPHHDPASHCGYTGPLTHTPALDPQPEVVLGKITCKGLILPYMVFEV